jgi:hypothetical protein
MVLLGMRAREICIATAFSWRRGTLLFRLGLSYIGGDGAWALLDLTHGEGLALPRAS